MTDIFEFWSHIGRGENIHPADKGVFARIDPKKHGFRTDCLPTCYLGRLRSAPVVLLYLSPGFEDQDLKDAASNKGKEYYSKVWRGDELLPDIGDVGYRKWPESHINSFVDYKIVKDKVAILNIGAYHSKKVKNYSSLLTLPSSRTSIAWAQDVLFPDAESGKRIVICMRSATCWGLDIGKTYGKSLFALRVTPSGYLVINDKNRQLIETVRDRLY